MVVPFPCPASEWARYAGVSRQLNDCCPSSVCVMKVPNDVNKQGASLSLSLSCSSLSICPRPLSSLLSSSFLSFLLRLLLTLFSFCSSSARLTFARGCLAEEGEVFARALQASEACDRTPRPCHRRRQPPLCPLIVRVPLSCVDHDATRAKGRGEGDIAHVYPPLSCLSL